MKINFKFLIFCVFAQVILGYFYEKQSVMRRLPETPSFISLSASSESSSKAKSLNTKTSDGNHYVYKTKTTVITAEGKVQQLDLKISSTNDGVIIVNRADHRKVKYQEYSFL